MKIKYFAFALIPLFLGSLSFGMLQEDFPEPNSAIGKQTKKELIPIIEAIIKGTEQLQSNCTFPSNLILRTRAYTEVLKLINDDNEFEAPIVMLPPIIDGVASSLKHVSKNNLLSDLAAYNRLVLLLKELKTLDIKIRNYKLSQRIVQRRTFKQMKRALTQNLKAQSDQRIDCNIITQTYPQTKAAL